MGRYFWLASLSSCTCSEARYRHARMRRLLGTAWRDRYGLVVPRPKLDSPRTPGATGRHSRGRPLFCTAGRLCPVCMYLRFGILRLRQLLCVHVRRPKEETEGGGPKRGKKHLPLRTARLSLPGSSSLALRHRRNAAFEPPWLSRRLATLDPTPCRRFIGRLEGGPQTP